MAFQLLFVTSDARFDLGQGGAEGAVRLAAKAVTLQSLAGGEVDPAIDAETVSLAADHDLGVAAAFEIFADAGTDFVGDPRTQSLPDVDMFA